MKKHQFTIFVLAIVFAATAIIGKAQTCPGSAGCLDPTFGNGGKITFSAATVSAVPRDIVAQSDGKIVSMFGNTNNNSTYYLMRNNADGSLDGSFGNNGIVTLTWGFVYKNSNYLANANAIATQNIAGTERILVAGSAPKLSGTKAQTLYRVDRFMPDGTLDTSFGTGGTVYLSLGMPNAMIVQPNDQKIVTVSKNAGELVRLTANGALDTTFGSGGRISSPDAYRVAIDPNGTIVVAGSVFNRQGNTTSNNVSLRRYSSNGVLDTSFGTNGVATVNSGYPSFTLKSVSIDFMRNIVISGRAEGASASVRDYGVARFTPAGFQDSSFSGDGFATAGFAGVDGQESTALVQSDGKIILVGSVWLSPTGGNYVDAGVARFNYDGSLDSSFGNGGKTIFDISGNDYVTGGKGGVIQTDPLCACEKIIVSGGNDYLTTFARLLTF